MGIIRSGTLTPTFQQHLKESRSVIEGSFTLDENVHLDHCTSHIRTLNPKSLQCERSLTYIVYQFKIFFLLECQMTLISVHKMLSISAIAHSVHLVAKNLMSGSFYIQVNTAKPILNCSHVAYKSQNPAQGHVVHNIPIPQTPKIYIT